MTALLLPRPTGPAAVRAAPVDEPVVLLQLDPCDVASAATAVYREVRRARRVVAVAAGATDAPARLAEALDAIGIVAAVRPSAHPERGPGA